MTDTPRNIDQCISFISEVTAITHPALVPELRLSLATELTPLWVATEEWLEEKNIAPPYWAFAWPGSIALARYVLDHAGAFRGLRVLDFGSGCGLAALAVARVGGQAIACDIDLMAEAATRLNAGLNGLVVDCWTRDITGQGAVDVDVILTGDVCYASPMSRAVVDWLARQKVRVLVADPGRTFLPDAIEGRALKERARYEIPVLPELESKTRMTTRILELLPA